MAICLQVENLTKSFGDLLLFENISFSVEQGERVGIVARNGAGKTTLLDIVAGRQSADSGSVVPRRDLRVAYLPQSPTFAAGCTVLEACFQGDGEALGAIAEYKRALASGDTVAIERSINAMDALSAWDYEQRAVQILSRLDITDLQQPVAQLSGGQLKRVALAAALISEADLLIMDEPTNHLDVEMTDWLAEYLRQSAAGLLLVTHDRWFLDSVTNNIVELDDRRLYRYRGNYSYYLEKRRERLATAAARRESEENIYKRELEWMRRQPQARGTKARSRIDSFHELEARLKAPGAGRTDVRLDMGASYIGTKIFRMRGISKSYGQKKLIEGFDYDFARYEKMGIVGGNGAGKSTFLKMLLGQVAPDAGEIEIGESVRFGYYSQTGMEFDPGKRVIDAISEIAEYVEQGDGSRISASQFLTKFLFPPAVQQGFIAKLSGGERRRLYLCSILVKSPNFLVLDEPTNDLDIPTLGVLEEYIAGFKGCVIAVSHDRWFMDKVADHLLVFRGDGVVKDFPGSYSDYIEWKRDMDAAERARRSASAPAADTRVRVRERKLTYNERKELAALEERIAQLEEEKRTLEGELSSGTLSVADLTAKSQRVGEIIADIDVKTERWMELSELA